MAIKKPLIFKGLSAEAAYIRVSGLSIQPGNTRITFCVNIMADRDNEPFEVSYGECEYSLEGGNPVRQVYVHLKTLDKYAGAEDC